MANEIKQEKSSFAIIEGPADKVKAALSLETGFLAEGKSDDAPRKNAITADVDRLKYVLGPHLPAGAIGNFQKQLKESFSAYKQGDYSGASIGKAILAFNSVHRLSIHPEEPPPEIEEVEFAYPADSDVPDEFGAPCGFSFVGTANNWAITLPSNTTSSPNEQKSLVITSRGILENYVLVLADKERESKRQPLTGNQTSEGNQIFNEISQVFNGISPAHIDEKIQKSLKSRYVKKLLKGIINKDGTANMELVRKLCAEGVLRGGQNIDHDEAYDIIVGNQKDTPVIQYEKEEERGLYIREMIAAIHNDLPKISLNIIVEYVDVFLLDLLKEEREGLFVGANAKKRVRVCGYIRSSEARVQAVINQITADFPKLNTNDLGLYVRAFLLTKASQIDNFVVLSQNTNWLVERVRQYITSDEKYIGEIISATAGRLEVEQKDVDTVVRYLLPKPGEKEREVLFTESSVKSRQSFIAQVCSHIEEENKYTKKIKQTFTGILPQELLKWLGNDNIGKYVERHLKELRPAEREKLFKIENEKERRSFCEWLTIKVMGVHIRLMLKDQLPLRMREEGNGKGMEPYIKSRLKALQKRKRARLFNQEGEADLKLFCEDIFEKVMMDYVGREVEQGILPPGIKFIDEAFVDEEEVQKFWKELFAAEDPKPDKPGQWDEFCKKVVKCMILEKESKGSNKQKENRQQKAIGLWVWQDRFIFTFCAGMIAVFVGLLSPVTLFPGLLIQIGVVFSFFLTSVFLHKTIKSLRWRLALIYISFGLAASAGVLISLSVFGIAIGGIISTIPLSVMYGLGIIGVVATCASLAYLLDKWTSVFSKTYPALVGGVLGLIGTVFLFPEVFSLTSFFLIPSEIQLLIGVLPIGVLILGFLIYRIAAVRKEEKNKSEMDIRENKTLKEQIAESDWGKLQDIPKVARIISHIAIRIEQWTVGHGITVLRPKAYVLDFLTPLTAEAYLLDLGKGKSYQEGDGEKLDEYFQGIFEKIEEAAKKGSCPRIEYSSYISKMNVYHPKGALTEQLGGKDSAKTAVNDRASSSLILSGGFEEKLAAQARVADNPSKEVSDTSLPPPPPMFGAS